MAVEGTYRVTVVAMGKQTEGTVNVHEQGTTLTGTVFFLGQDIPLEDGKVNGNTFSGTARADTPLGNMKGKVKGSVTGDKVEGSITAGLMKATFSGTRI